MSHSQFDTARVVTAAQAPPTLIATGPLQDVDLRKYVPPFVIHVTIIQTRTEQDHDPRTARRAIGVTTMDAEGEWEATLHPVTEDTAFDPARSARGIGVAVLARTEGYASEVLTWCDHIVKLDGTPRPT
jgi:hypothetical protein